MAEAVLKAKASLDGKQFDSEVKKLGNSVQQFGSNQLAGLKGMIAGAFTTGAITSFGRDILQTMTRLKDLSIQGGVSTDEFQGLSMVVRKAGSDENQLASALSKVDKAQQDALGGNKQTVASFAALGITLDNLIKMNPAELFAEMSKALAAAHMTGEPLKATMDIIGQKIAPQLKQSMMDLAAQGLQGAIDKSKELGESFDKDFIERVKKADDVLEGWGRKVKVRFTDLASYILDFGKTFREFEKYTEGMSKSEKMAFKEKYVKDPRAARAEMDKGTSRSPEFLKMQERLQRGLAEAETGFADTAEQAQRRALSEKTAKEEAKKNAAKQAEFDAKRAEQITANENKRDELYRQQDDLALDSQQRQKDILKGKGIQMPDMARVDSLQRMGGLVGNAAGGPADQAARIAERQTKIAEEIKREIQNTNQKLEELGRKIDDLGGVDS